MIVSNVPPNIQLVPPGVTYRKDLLRAPINLDWYSEFMGGLGDALLRVYMHTGCYKDLESVGPGKKAAAVIMCHNPSFSELFQYHPAHLDGRLQVFDLGFNGGTHPWEDPNFRRGHGMPELSPCPQGGPAGPLPFYLHPKDEVPMKELSSIGAYAIVNHSAGSVERDIPEEMVDGMVKALRGKGITPIIVGHQKYQRRPLHPGIVSFIGRLSLPGTILAERNAVAVVTSHTSVLHIAWAENRPVFLLYPRWVEDVWLAAGKKAIGYFFGADQEKTDHMEFREYTKDRFFAWVGKLG